MTDTLPSFIVPGDLDPFGSIPAAKAVAMIESATAQAVLAAPCLSATDLTDVQKLAVKGILRTAILRWDEAGTGAKSSTSVTAGPFTQSETIDHSQERRGVFWPSEIRALQSICKTAPRPYNLDMGAPPVSHALWCAWSMGANYCDCGVELGMV